MMGLFALTALASAFLLFWVEPLFARMVLPLLGGSPAVWNTCLMFFQAMLLVGYLYAHLTTRFLPQRRQPLVHLTLLAAALLALPIAIPAGWTPPATERPIGWLLALLLVAVGAPFLMLSATAPLLQRWIAELDHPMGSNPYLLYAASNAGSLLGLFAFPIALEPVLRLRQQSTLWSVGYLLSCALMGICVAAVLRHPLRQPKHWDSGQPAEPVDPDPRLRDRVRWVVLAFVPSSLLLGVTTYLATDVATVPFLWVIPLALYLSTFIVVFARPGRLPPRAPLELHAALVTVFVILAFWGADLPQRWAYPLHLGLFAITALVLHGELAAARPGPAHLTEYYLWLALGGALGGAFNALVAPLLFRTPAEYVPMVVAASLLRPSQLPRIGGLRERLRSLALASLPALILAVSVAFHLQYRRLAGIPLTGIVSLTAAAIVLSLRSTILFGASLAGLALAGLLMRQPSGRVLYAGRSFYGAYRVTEDGPARFFWHGTTIHGGQFVNPKVRTQPITYYHPEAPLGRLLDSARSRLDNKHIGVVGLGTGTLLCYGTPGQQWTVFEIDPLVVEIARDSAYFTFLRDCPVEPRVVLGDARVTLAKEPDAYFSVLVLDAFSSDAVPVHLLTREAFKLYDRLLKPGGFLLVNITNRNLDLEPVIAALAADAGYVGRVARHITGYMRAKGEVDYSCDWAVLTRRGEDLERLVRGAGDWVDLVAPAHGTPWSDDYSNIFRSIRW
jgi:hypothetical protein